MTFGKQGRTYRRIASQETDAIFSFGWGLSYSQFSYSKLLASKASVSVTVTNTGKTAGAEVRLTRTFSLATHFLIQI